MNKDENKAAHSEADTNQAATTKGSRETPGTDKLVTPEDMPSQADGDRKTVEADLKNPSPHNPIKQ